jgi:hypothetical protein
MPEATNPKEAGMDPFQAQRARDAEAMRQASEQNRREAAGRAAAALALANAERARQHGANMASARREAERQAQEATNLRNW